MLAAAASGVHHEERPIDLIYNRHCDFYLERPEMAGIRAAYQAGTVCLTPNPFVYGLLADKRRMVLWSDRDVLTGLGLAPRSTERLLALVPESHLLAALDPEKVWTQREGLVFKPVSRFGSRGVLLGRKISRTRFETLPPQETLVQRLVPPSLTETGGRGAAEDRLPTLRLPQPGPWRRRPPLPGAGDQSAHRRWRIRGGSPDLGRPSP